MAELTSIVPRLKSEIEIRSFNDAGDFMVKRPRRQKFLKFGEREKFLLVRLDGQRSYGAIIEAFLSEYGEEVTCRELERFFRKARKRGLVEKQDRTDDSIDAVQAKPRVRTFWYYTKKTLRRLLNTNPLYFRVKLCDPDRVLNWLEPRTRWLFTKQTGMIAVIGAAAAVFIAWTKRDELINLYTSDINWLPIALAWLTIVVATVFHEFGHALACKKYGGEVREMGVLWIFFMPCFYCNVSDAWFLKNKWQRILIGAAGTYVDLLIWIAAVLVWSVSGVSTALHYMAWVIITTCGLRLMANLSPFLKMDGYYILSDMMGIHNLKNRGRGQWMSFVRRWLWGAPQAAPKQFGTFLFWYGAIGWLVRMAFLGFLYYHLTGWLELYLGVVGKVTGAVLIIYVAKRYFRGILGRDFGDMLRQRRLRAVVLSGVVVSVLFAAAYVTWDLHI
jgi:putative peptide zinc metalloprotease protein